MYYNKIKNKWKQKLTGKVCTMSSILQNILHRIETKQTTRVETKTCQTTSSCHQQSILGARKYQFEEKGAECPLN